MKVYIVWSIPEYIGIDVEYVFLNESDAQKCVDEHNASAPSYDKWDYEVHDVL